jgi:membrane peptidoglycan carboxypeptidase
VNAATRPGSDAGWRRFLPSWRQVLWVVLGAFLLLVLLVVVGYLTTGIPAANAIVKKQTTYLYYSDGKTELGRLGTVNRTSVPLSDVPPPVRQAVLAAEDRNFYHEAGISPTGILRALWVDVTGGEVKQGGSTITQQYAKNAYLTQDRTFTRKIKEIFIAVKLDHSRSKDRVLQDYLNTIYFGRGAYGIEAASRAYFGKPVHDLDAAQGAVLAGLIRSPSGLDPAVNPAGAQRRWHQVIDGMVKGGWLTPQQASGLQFPTKSLIPPSRATNTVSGPNGYVIQAVKKELTAKGFDESRLNLGGYRVVTTIDKRAQDAAVKAEQDILASRRAAGGEPLSALVAVQPGNGAVRAMYGGQDYGSPNVPKSFVNLAYEPRQPGSSFKPYTLVTALEQGIGLNTAYDGSSPKHVRGYGAKQEVQNDSGEQCPYPCTLTVATARSINTVFVPLAVQVGPKNVRNTAYDMGVARSNPLSDQGGFVGAGITLGIYDVRPIDQAVGYATIADGGTRATPYLVAKVLDNGGHTVYEAHPDTSRAIDPDVAANAAYAMRQVLESPQGTASGKTLPGRPAAGKTGTTTNNADAWFVGFTPQLSTAVWMGNKTESEPLTNVRGFEGGVYGGGLPASIWQEFMTSALAGQPVMQFPTPTFSGHGQSPSPARTTSGGASPTTSPSLTPTVTPSIPLSPTVTPSPTLPPSTQPSPSPTATQSPPPPSPSASATAQPGGGGHAITASPPP